MADLDSIRAQVEFYFGLDNLMQDAFLLGRMNSRMMVPLSMIFSFKKIRQLSTSFDQVLAAVQQSPNKLVVECDASDGEWWIGPNPQALPESQCTIVLSDIPDDITVEDIESLTEVPLLHSYNFADGTWHATYQDKYAAKAALNEMQKKKLRGSVVNAKLKTEAATSPELQTTSSTLNRNAEPYQVPVRVPRTPNNTPTGTPSARTFGFGNAKVSPVAGCPLYVSRNPLASQRPADSVKRGNNAILSTFYSMTPAQQQMFMMNFMMQQQLLMQQQHQNVRSDVGDVPPFQLNGGHQRYPHRFQRRNESRQAPTLAPIGEDIDDNETKKKLEGPLKNQQHNQVANSSENQPSAARMEALGADLPDDHYQEAAHQDTSGSTPSAVAENVSKPRQMKKHEKSAPAGPPPPVLNAFNFPTLGQELSVNQPLSGWAAAIAKPPASKPKEVESNETALPQKAAKKKPVASDENIDETPKKTKKECPVSSESAQAPADSVSAPRSYASLLAK